MRLPETHYDMTEAFKNTLERGRGIIKGEFIRPGTTTSRLENYAINRVGKGDEYKSCNLELQLKYKESVVTAEDRYIEIDRVQNLVVMSTKGDPLWYRKTIIDVWEGEYPSGVAYDKETHEIYFIFLKMSVMIMKRFTRLTEKEYEAVEMDLNQDKPYRICLSNESMYKVLAGIEGSKHLREEMYLELDTGVILEIPQR